MRALTLVLNLSLSFALITACDRDDTDEETDTESDSVEETDSDDLDEVGDGYNADVDCDDDNAAIHPGQAEVCDEVDNDCDGVVDNDPTDGTMWYADADADGQGDADVSQTACEKPTGYVDNHTDCDDEDNTAFVGGVEACGGGDEDCDGEVDEAGATGESTFYTDYDADTHGDPERPVSACTLPVGAAVSNDDCDDTRADTYPGAPETCDGDDQDCDGEVDEDATDQITWYQDLDADGDGTNAGETMSCTQPTGYAATHTDCDDNDPNRYSSSGERCDGVDNDCDGVLDNGLDLQPFYADLDGDGHAGGAAIQACAAPSGYTADNTDCDDNDALVNPDVTEVCTDGRDDDCDGAKDCEQESCNLEAPECAVCPNGIVQVGEQCDDGNSRDGDGCDRNCRIERDLSGVFSTYASEGRDVLIWKSNPSAPISSYETFCDDRGLSWFEPKSQADAQALITNAFNLDRYHTWIITQNKTGPGTLGGYSVTVDSPDCVTYVDEGFSAIRQWGCSYCDPKVDGDGTTKCWDSDHQYDWLVCE